MRITPDASEAGALSPDPLANLSPEAQKLIAAFLTAVAQHLDETAPALAETITRARKILPAAVLEREALAPLQRLEVQRASLVADLLRQTRAGIDERETTVCIRRAVAATEHLGEEIARINRRLIELCERS